MKFHRLILGSLLISLPALMLAQNVGGAESDSKNEQPASKEAAPAVVEAEAPKKVLRDNQCLASEEIIQDLETRENTVKQKEAALAESQKEIEAQKAALKQEVAKLEAMRAEVQGIRGKDLAEREEKVNKLIETFESMSPKSAAAVISKVDEELAVTALSRLSTVKAGKILAAMDSGKSSRLSEMMAFGNTKVKGKEKDNNGDTTQRAPASSR